MNNIIREYPIPFPSDPSPRTLRLPDGARLLSVRAATLDGRAALVLAARIDPAAEAENRMADRTIRVVRPGDRTGTATRYIGEVELEGGERVWVFEGP